MTKTPLHLQYADSLVYDELFSDLATQSVSQDAVEEALVVAHPELFSNFFSIPTRWLDRQYFRGVHALLNYGKKWFPNLLLGLQKDSGEILDVYDAWVAWRGAETAEAISSVEELGAPYEATGNFRRTFLRFVRECYVSELSRYADVISALVDYEIAFGHARERSWLARERAWLRRSASVERPAPGGQVTMTVNSVVTLASAVRKLELDLDYREVLQALRNGGDLADLPATPTTLVGRPASRDEFDIFQLSDLSASILNLCAVDSTVGEILKEYARRQPARSDLPAEKVCEFGLRKLVEEQLLTVI